MKPESEDLMYQAFGDKINEMYRKFTDVQLLKYIEIQEKNKRPIAVAAEDEAKKRGLTGV